MTTILDQYFMIKIEKRTNKKHLSVNVIDIRDVSKLSNWQKIGKLYLNKMLFHFIIHGKLALELNPEVSLCLSGCCPTEYFKSDLDAIQVVGSIDKHR